MAWCPNCKTEYREGIEKCADCGSILVKSLNEEERTEESCSLLFGDEKHVRMIEEHLKAEGFSSAFSVRRKNSENEGGEQGKHFELFIAASEREAAVKCAAEFMRSTNPQAEEAVQNPNSHRVMTAKAEPVQEFVTAKEKQSDMKSSGIMLLIFGVAGLAFMFLVIFGVIPIRFSGFNAVIAYSVMGLFFGVLFISGIMSLVKAKKMAGVGEEEQKKLDDLKIWCDKNLSKDSILERVPGDVSEDEQLYFARFDYMKGTLQAAFPDLGDDFLEYYTEQLYSDYFES